MKAPKTIRGLRLAGAVLSGGALVTGWTAWLHTQAVRQIYGVICGLPLAPHCPACPASLSLAALAAICLVLASALNRIATVGIRPSRSPHCPPVGDRRSAPDFVRGVSSLRAMRPLVTS